MSNKTKPIFGLLAKTWREVKYRCIREFVRPIRFKYRADGMATNNNCDFLSDPKFTHVFAVGKAVDPIIGVFDFQWRQRVVCWAAEQAFRLDGDFVECGVNRGMFSRMILEYLPSFTSSGKRFWLLDTFEGLVRNMLLPEEEDAKCWERHQPLYAPCYDLVCQTFAPFESSVRIIKGTVPDTLPLVEAEKIAYLSIDMNCAAPEIAAAEFFWHKMVPGGIVVLDDYGFDGYEAQKEAFNRFAEKHHIAILPLPTGQGIMIKQ